MEDANPDTVDDGLINLVKIRMLRNYIVSVFGYRKGIEAVLAASMSFSETILFDFFTLECRVVRDSEKSYDRSLELEPRES
jgi:hypothetical protein